MEGDGDGERAGGAGVRGGVRDAVGLTVSFAVREVEGEPVLEGVGDRVSERVPVPLRVSEPVDDSEREVEGVAVSVRVVEGLHERMNE